MSWGITIPWSVLTKMCNKNLAMQSGAMENEVHPSWMRDDYLY